MVHFRDVNLQAAVEWTMNPWQSPRVGHEVWNFKEIESAKEKQTNSLQKKERRSRTVEDPVLEAWREVEAECGHQCGILREG